MFESFLEGIQFCSNEKIVLYHGSREGIRGEIEFSNSNEFADFGPGFYMTNDEEQAKIFASCGTSPTCYHVEVDLGNLPALQLRGFACALFVALNRGWLQKDTRLEKIAKFIKNIENNDWIVAPIVDDRMYDGINKFLDNNLSYDAFMFCFNCLIRGYQYVAKTERALAHINIEKVHNLFPEECVGLKNIAAARKAEAIRITQTEWKKDRRNRDKLYFTDILDMIDEKPCDSPTPI